MSFKLPNLPNFKRFMKPFESDIGRKKQRKAIPKLEVYDTSGTFVGYYDDKGKDGIMKQGKGVVKL